MQKGFLNGFPNTTVNLITKNLNPSPGTVKGHMKQPQYGIKSTRMKQSSPAMLIAPDPPPIPKSYMEMPSVPAPPQVRLAYLGHPGGNTAGPNLVIGDDEDNKSSANMFCFGAFADRNSGIVYHDLTGSFLLMLYNRSVCFFILYHYKSNPILATPIAGLVSVSIFQAYKQQFEMLKLKGFKSKLNIMDNQAAKHIKNLLTENECTSLLSPTTIASTRPNKQSRHLRTHLFLHWQ